MLRKLAAAFVLCALLLSLSGCGGLIQDGRANVPLSSALLHRIAAIGSTPGAAMMMRIFKKSSVLEVWKQTSSGRFALLGTYKICAWSGGLGPKIAEGDRQSPEGFYEITPRLLNPHSNYYLAFNTGFPNKFDSAHNRTGSNLMIHGDCSSRGCYAMTNAEIADLYALARESLAGGNPSVQLEIFPFRMTPQNMAAMAGDPNFGFWKNLKTGYDVFELTHRPPHWDVCAGQYVFDAVPPNGQPLNPVAACPPLKRDPTLVAALSAREAADTIAFNRALATTEAAQAAELDQAQKAATKKAVLAERGKAIGSFLGGIFGGDTSSAPSATPDPSAPIPVASPERS